ncbi:MAG TPA: hypothetical protein DHV48_04690 [Prolixibacteraceae bacterium]|nr:hypothetical protein [Prolixibacteraceae bacterium]
MFVRIFFTVFFLSIVIQSSGQFTYPRYRQYTLRDGLSQMQVMCLFQDSRGYIWAGTKEGLNCFNGDKITSYSEKDGLASSYIHDIEEDQTGAIWVSTRSGLACFDGSKITSFPHNDQLSIELALTPDGKIWYAGTDQNRNAVLGYLKDGKYTDKSEFLPIKKGYLIFRYCKKDDSFIITNQKEIWELKNNKVRHLLSTENDFLLVGNDSTVLIYDHENNNILRIWEYREREIVYVGNFEGDDFNSINRVKGNYTFHEDVNENLIILNKNGLVKNRITEIEIIKCLVDRDKHLWLATEEGVLQVFSGGFETYKREFLPVVWSMVEDLEQNLWFASYFYGLKKFDGKSVKSYPAEDLQKYALNFYFQPQVDKRGILYFPNNYGIFYTDGKIHGAIRKEPCLATFYDKERDLLFGGYRMFVEVYNKNHQPIRTIGKSDGLEFEGYISSFGKDHLGNIWMGGFSGLSRYDWDKNSITNYNRDNGKLPSDGVLSIFTTPDGRTWFGSTHGLLWYDSKTDSVKKIEQEDISGTVSFVTAIDSTWLVFSQSTGIYLMDLKKFNHSGEVELYFFNENNGFLGIDPGQNGALVDSKGNIWMTSSTELVKLDPRKLDFQNYSVNVRISHFNGQRLPFVQEKISLPKNDRTAIVQFETICFNRPKLVQYSWKIDDGEHDWSPWQENDYAILTDLRDGKSQIQVKARILGLPDAEAIAAMPIVVNLALWKQEWFFPTLLGLVSVLVVFALVLLFLTRIRMIQINKQAKMFQLQAILSQMNPHFIFNVMAALQSMILSANIEKANDYLVKMSNLVRGFLDASVSTSMASVKDLHKSELPLKKELDILTSYINFQQLIYPEKFDFVLFTDPLIDLEHQTIPPMLIQPFVENSIRHGLLQKGSKGTLRISILSSGKNILKIEITDDGIGIQKASRLINQSRLLFTSRGKELTVSRIKLLNEMGYNIHIDTSSSDQETTVTITIISTYEN